MKKVNILIFISWILGISIISCKKSRTCSCVNTTTWKDGTTTEIEYTSGYYTYNKSGVPVPGNQCLSFRPVLISADGAYTEQEQCALK